MHDAMLLATDLDRTLLPNGIQEYDDSMEIFRNIISNEKITLVFVTGRNLKLIDESITEFNVPEPDYIIADVGTNVYRKDKEKKFILDERWIKEISDRTKNWNVDLFKDELSLLKGLRIQEDEKQNVFKLSYYIDDLSIAERINREVTKIIKSICKKAAVVYSIDEKNKIGLLDILPQCATKLQAVEYVRSKLNLKKEHVIYCGDSGNDILPLTAGYYAILVRNSIDDVKGAVKEIMTQKNYLDKLYIAQGYKKLNGYYVSGIIEGLINLNFVSQKYIED